MKQEIGVYKITHVESKRFYVGSSVNVKMRVDYHLSALRKGVHGNQYLQNAYNKYGESAFTFRAHRYCATPEEARVVEQSFLDNPKYFGVKLFNISRSSTGGNLIAGLSDKDYEALRKRKSKTGKIVQNRPEVKKRKSELNSGSGNPMYGKKHTEESKSSMSKNQKAGWTKARKKAHSEKRKKYFEDNPEARTILQESGKRRKGELNAFFGKTHSEETKARIREKAKQRYSEGNVPSNSRKVKAHGKVYNSVSECARLLGVAPMTVIFRIKSNSEKFKTYKYKD